jgi:hypothetical protein
MNIESLRPLLESSPRFEGEVFVHGIRGKGGICLSCGAMDSGLMIRKHKKTCKWKLWHKAMQTLRDELDKA